MAKAKQYVQLDYLFLHSRARRLLSLAAREVYTQIRGRRNIKNSRGKVLNRSDDRIRFGFSDANGMSKPTFQRAVMELEEAGFIDTVEPGGFPNKKAAYAISNRWMADGEWRNIRILDPNIKKKRR